MKSLKVLEKALDSPCEVPVAQLNRVEIGIQHLWGEHFKVGRLSSTASAGAYKNFGRRWNARDNRTLSPRISLGIVILRNLWLGEVMASALSKLQGERELLKEGSERARDKWLITPLQSGKSPSPLPQMSFPPLSLRLKIGMFFQQRAEVWGLQLGAVCLAPTSHVPQKEKPFKVVKWCKLLVCCGCVTTPVSDCCLYSLDLGHGHWLNTSCEVSGFALRSH